MGFTAPTRLSAHLNPVQGVIRPLSLQRRILSSQPWNENEDDLSRPLPLPLAPSTRSRPSHKKKIRPSPKIGRLILVRHGQSVWNVTDPSRDLTARFVSYCFILFSFVCKKVVIPLHTSSPNPSFFSRNQQSIT